MAEISGTMRQVIVLLVSLVVSILVGVVPEWKRVGFTTADQTLLSIGLFISFLLLDVLWLVSSAESKASKEYDRWVLNNAGDRELADIRSYFAKIVQASYGPRDLFVSHFQERFQQLKNDIKDSAEKGELRVRADHFLNVENVTDSFLGDTERIWRHVWPIRGNEKLFDDLAGKRYFEVTAEMARNGQIACIRSIVIFDEPSVAQTPRVTKLLDFFKTNTGVECRVMQRADYETLCTDNSIAPHCDFGIYGNRLLFLTQQYEPVITGTFTKDTDLIARYIRLFDSMWNSLSVTKQNPSQATTAVTVEELFTFDERPLG